jgi:type IV pilus assembly protein PilQ
MMGPTTVAVIAAAIAHAAINTAPLRTASHHALATNFSTSDSSAPRADEGLPGRGRVSGISVAPAAAGAEIIIAIDTGVSVRHFVIDGPTRLVIDLGGASLAMRNTSYDGQARGAIRNLRLSQFRADTVRLVIDLDAKHEYTVSRSGGELHLTVAGGTVAFAPWQMTSGAQPIVAAAAGRLDVASPAPKADSTKTRAKSSEVVAVAEQQTVKTSVTRTESAPVEKRPEVLRPETIRANAQADAHADRTPLSVASTQKMHVDAESPTAAKTAPAPVAPTAAQQPRRQAPKPRITVNYDGTDIRDVIGSFATFSGRTIVVGKDVAGTVTADISDKPWDVALQAILQAQGLAATEDASGIITVDSYRNLASNQALEPTITQIVDVNYAKATALAKTVVALLGRDCTGLTSMNSGVPMNQGSSSNGNQSQNNPGAGQGCVVRGSVVADSATNKLIITDVPSRLPEIIARLKELDIRTQQVAIKAKIIFVNRTGIQDIGLAYDLGTGNKQFFQQLVPRTDPSTLKPIDTNGDGVPDALGGGTPFEGPARIALGGNAIAGIANANNAIKPNALNLIYSTALGRYQLTAFLNALQTSSLAETQSEPSITILNNRAAEIFVGQEIPIRVIDASSGSSGGSSGGSGGGNSPNAGAFFPRASVSKEEAGIKLSVTPQITNNRMVLMNIKAENSSAELAATDVGVIFNRQRAESQVLVGDGEAAVIGGLTVTETTRFRTGIPFLMNLPFVGRLFSQNSKNETKRDLLILVTPHILDDGVTPPPGR